MKISIEPMLVAQKSVLIQSRWDAANLQSVALAEKLGYHFEKGYEVYSIY